MTVESNTKPDSEIDPRAPISKRRRGDVGRCLRRVGEARGNLARISRVTQRRGSRTRPRASRTFSFLFARAGRPASRAAPASDASCQAIGGGNGLLSPRGERGISGDLAPRPQPLPRAVPAAGTSAECAAKVYWHPFRRHAGVDPGGGACSGRRRSMGRMTSGPYYDMSEAVCYYALGCTSSGY